MDFNDEDEPSTARPAFKFQPKAKAKAKPQAPPLKKVTAASSPSAPQQAADNQLVPSSAKAEVPNNDISYSVDTISAGVKSADSIEQTTTLQTSSSSDPLLSFIENVSIVNPADMEENANSKDIRNQTGESMIESTEAFAGLDFVDNLMPKSTIVTDATCDASDSRRAEDMTASPSKQEQLSCKESVDYSNVGDIQMESIQLETKGEQACTLFESFDFMSEVGASSGKIASKLKPKLKQMPGKKAKAIEFTSAPKDTLVSPSESQNTDEGSVEGRLTDFPLMRVDDVFSTSPSNECFLNQVGSFEATPDSIYATNESFLNQMEELPQSSLSLVHDLPSQQHVPLSEPMNAQTVPVVSEVENDNGHNEQDVPVVSEVENNNVRDKEEISAVFELENSNVHNEEGVGSKKRKASRKSKKDANGSDKSVLKRKKTEDASEGSAEPNGSVKPVRKRKKTKDASEAPIEQQPPKKFSRTTRRRNRCIDKTLLETPEDEIDYQRLPIKDLIMLAEHRERQIKETNTEQTVMPAEQNTATEAEPVYRDTYSQWDPYDDYDDTYNTVEPEDNPSTMAVERDTAYFNYHSHMNKTPRVKWTKQDTELFYEGVHQFGSDLSMILHLFPGRTRQQLKLKYKKEERQQPVRLLDALTNRPKDLSHYKLVIEKLQEQIDLEEDQQMAEEEAFLATAGNEGNPEEGNGAGTQEQEQDEGSKSEQNGDGSGEAKIGSPAASYESDLDMGGWSPYRSTL